MAREVGQILGEISEDEHRQGRPMLSAVAVSTSGQPGEGFYELARALGKLKSESLKESHLFWERERAAVYDEWAEED